LDLGFLLTALAQEDISPAALPIEKTTPPAEETMTEETSPAGETDTPEPVLEEAVPAPVTEMIKADEEISPEELEVKEPIILPDNPLYIVKDAWRGIKKAVTFNPVKKAELELQYANEKIIETKKWLKSMRKNSKRPKTPFKKLK
jgi:hypothetical protein